jgi:hypothetical protein
VIIGIKNIYPVELLKGKPRNNEGLLNRKRDMAVSRWKLPIFPNTVKKKETYVDIAQVGRLY